METKHTPGPWNFHGSTLVQDKGNRLNLGTFQESPGLGNAAAANARLISAAPDLLRVLQLIHANAAESPEWIRSRIDPIIARATGNQ